MGNGITKGIAYINRGFKYQIHATDRKHDRFGTVVVNSKLEDFDSEVTIYDSGIVVIESPHRRMEFNLKDGRLKCE